MEGIPESSRTSQESRLSEPLRFLKICRMRYAPYFVLYSDSAWWKKMAASALFCDKHHVRLMNDRNLFMNVLNASKLPTVNSAWCAAWR